MNDWRRAMRIANKSVLVDRHHAGLFHSMQLLFENRLGCVVYTPIGHEWWDEGYWRFGEVWGDDRLAKQYLGDHNFMRPNEHAVGDHNFMRPNEHAAWVTYDPEFPGRAVLGVTLEQARGMQWRAIVATVQENQHGLHRFAQEHGAQYVVQVGNTGQQIDWSLDPLVLNNSEMPMPGQHVDIGQEFLSGPWRTPGVQPIFGFRPIRWRRTISSFVNVMPQIACYPLLQQARAALPEFHFAVHGIDGPEGNIKPINDTAALMAASGWGWHDKIHGDGFGHVLHYWAAIGRPIIGHASHYAGKRGEVFWRDLETCIDLDRHPLDEAVALIREISADPARHDAMGNAIRRVFDEHTDWEGDARKVQELLGWA